MATRKNRAPARASAASAAARAASPPSDAGETPFETIAGLAFLLVQALFLFTLLGQNFVIPSGSMEKTLLVGDHLFVDRITLSQPAAWMPLMHYREPRRGDVVVFYRPLPQPEPGPDGKPQYSILVKRLIGLPGDRIHLHDGIVFLNGVAQGPPKEGLDTEPSSPRERGYLDEFPAVLPTLDDTHGALDSWIIDLPNHLDHGDLVVPAGSYFMMGDHRHGSLDSRFWGFVPRANILGRPLFNYWSFMASQAQYEQKGVGNAILWMGHVALHFFTDTRWKRTLHFVG